MVINISIIPYKILCFRNILYFNTFFRIYSILKLTYFWWQKNELICSLLFIFYSCDLMVNHKPSLISAPDAGMEIASQFVTN